MQTNELILKPAVIFAFLKTLPLLLCGAVLMLLAWYLSPYLLFFSLAFVGVGWYRFIFIRSCKYMITPEVVRITRGLFFKRTDQVEMYRIKDYIITQPFMLQVFKLMDLTLKSTDPENPVICLRGIPESDIIDTIRDHVQEARRHNRIYELN